MKHLIFTSSFKNALPVSLLALVWVRPSSYGVSSRRADQNLPIPRARRIGAPQVRPFRSLCPRERAILFSENVVFFGLLRPEKASLLSGAQGALFSFWSFFLKFLESLSCFMRVAFKNYLLSFFGFAFRVSLKFFGSPCHSFSGWFFPVQLSLENNRALVPFAHPSG